MADEIELKFEIENYEEIARELISRAKLISSAYELTVMHDQGKKLFEKDARLRLRKIINLKTNQEKAEFSYKKPKTREGIKIEEEYESEVRSFDEVEKILENIGFVKVSSYERIRDTFEKEGVKITIDSFPFGDYIEFEGDMKLIQKIGKEFGFEMSKNITKSCDDLYAEICIAGDKEIEDHIVFANKDLLEKQKQKRDFLVK